MMSLGMGGMMKASRKKIAPLSPAFFCPFVQQSFRNDPLDNRATGESCKVENRLTHSNRDQPTYQKTLEESVDIRASDNQRLSGKRRDQDLQTNQSHQD
jgi:hypothetical protein